MNKTEVMFFFDTEDFTSNQSAEAILREAEICTQEGITAHFAIVGLLASQLENWGRKDIIDALKPHIIGTHTYGHSLHPNICQQSDHEDFNKAFENVAHYEDEALEMINRALNPENILFACPPGNSKSYVSMYYYADRDIPFYCDTVVHDGKGTALHYCNQEHISYYKSMESLFFKPDVDLDAFLDKLYKDTKRAIIYTHPNVAVKTEFWDKLNYDKENIRDFGDWIEAPNRAKEETEMFYSYMRKLIRKIKEDDRFKITNLNEILQKRRDRTPLTPYKLGKIYSSLKADFYPTTSPSYSLADIFLAFVNFLRGEKSYTPGKVFGFLEEPIGTSEVCTLTAAGIKKAAQAMDISKFLPSQIEVDGFKIGPADFLMAGLDLLVNDKKTVEVLPKNQLISLDDLDELKNFNLKGTWTHSDDLEDKFLSDRLKLQSWTLRFE